MAKLKVVIDTNILISAAFLKASPLPDTIYQALKHHRFLLVTSPDIIKEIDDVINRETIIARTQMTLKERTSFIQNLIEISIITTGQTTIPPTSRDIKDDKFLICAYESQADYLITGDKDLLILKQYQSTEIVTPNKFISILESQK